MGARELIRETVDFLRIRKRAYQLAFGTNKRVLRLRTAYRLVFMPYAGQHVLVDLAKFCRAAETTFHPSQDERAQAVLEGRRQVWLRIEQHLRLNQDQLFALYAGQNFNVAEEKNDGG